MVGTGQGSFAYAEAELKFMHLSSHVPPSETAPQTFLATRGRDIRSWFGDKHRDLNLYT